MGRSRAKACAKVCVSVCRIVAMLCSKITASTEAVLCILSFKRKKTRRNKYFIQQGSITFIKSDIKNIYNFTKYFFYSSKNPESNALWFQLFQQLFSTFLIIRHFS